jgi:hypothetical protein
MLRLQMGTKLQIKHESCPATQSQVATSVVRRFLRGIQHFERADAACCLSLLQLEALG